MNKHQLKYLRSLANNRKPVIWVGQHGLSDSVLEEINISLAHHELIKIKLRMGKRVERERICDDICVKTRAELIQKIGNTVTVYRRNTEVPVIQLPANIREK